MSMKIALFGGTFDPPHHAHWSVSEAAWREFGLDRVWWIPSGEPPHKAPQGVSPYERRLAMVRLATAAHPAFCAKDLERAHRGPTYTVDTVEAVRKAYPGDDFWLLIGEDSLRQFHQWRSPERIAALVPLIVYRRASVHPEPALLPYLRGRVAYCEAPRVPLAGTAIRRRVAGGTEVTGLVSNTVRAYIEQHGLYRSLQCR